MQLAMSADPVLVTVGHFMIDVANCIPGGLSLTGMQALALSNSTGHVLATDHSATCMLLPLLPHYAVAICR
jgi:hypothetical protein